MSSPTPYDRARALLEAGTAPKDVVAQLVDTGIDHDSARVVVASLVGKRPLDVEQLGDAELGIGLDGLQPGIEFRWKADTVVDAQLNIVFGAFTAIAGVVFFVLWAGGYVYSFLMFAVVLLALARIKLSDIWRSLLRVAFAGLLAVWAVMRGSEAFVAGAVIMFGVGAYHIVRGLIVLQRLQAQLSAPPLTAPSPAVQSDAQPPLQ